MCHTFLHEYIVNSNIQEYIFFMDLYKYIFLEAANADQKCV